MKVHCPKCSPKEIDIPEFSYAKKIKLSEMAPVSFLQTVKLLIDEYALSHTDAKYIVMHINHTYGHCKRCNNNTLTGEYINCPKCGALNFNWEFKKEIS